MKRSTLHFLFVIPVLILSSCDVIVPFPYSSTFSTTASSISLPSSLESSTTSSSVSEFVSVSTSNFSSSSDIVSSSLSFSSSSELPSSNTSLSSSMISSSESTSIASTSQSTSTSTSGITSSSSTSAVASSSSTTSYTYDGYYTSIHGVSDGQLKSKLTTLLRSILDANNLLPSNVSYGNARYDIPKYDRDPNNASHVILVYSRQSVSGTWDGGTTWNREHVFPQSLMGVETTNTNRHKGADYHNLKPESPSVNTSRGNKYFAETTTTTSYAPPAVVRGDLARIMFYMVTMWPELSLVDVVSGDPAIYTMAQLSLFVKWHHEDPVDTFESNRNDVIYGLQGNRNPYVDHQELVCRIWGPSNPTTQSYCPA